MPLSLSHSLITCARELASTIPSNRIIHIHAYNKMSKPLILSRLHNYPSPDSPYSTVYNIPHTGALRKFDGIRLASDTLHTHTRIYIRIRCIPETFTAARDAGLRAKIYGFRRRRRRRRLREYRLSRSLPRGQSPGDGRRDERERAPP